MATLFDDFACGSWDEAKLRDRLEQLAEDMWKGWQELVLVAGRAGMGGGSLWGPLVSAFIDHVRVLSQDDSHLYSAFQS